MRSRLSTTTSLLQHLESTLQTFLSSGSRFRVVRTISPSAGGSVPPTRPSPALSSLYILDSSFNPPTLAHSALARVAGVDESASEQRRLVLLFSTANADKVADPSAYVNRLAMVHLFALELSDSLNRRGKQSIGQDTIPSDIALTSTAFYSDKAAAISSTSTPVYPPQTRQIYLLGYDTFTRFLSPKYYSSHEPPLSALDSFFASGCELCVMMRPDGSESAREEQAGYLARLRDGMLNDVGFRAEWSEKIEMVEAEKDAVGVSSTVVREAVADGRHDDLQRLCFPSVARWIEEHGLYKR
ncbi:Nucleotidylyl transferase [Eremomyces bilateralis CBS 781.70]|uniref:Nucleotidylyl transferase n=1 Tax=Eremomyces bilateralis CBS 781.70 TaxID=1392243 RepID=A0A6G1G9E5_9PEZI|nr:Nucleotidylyl transferase [Eremomyces bilateralis CBS 781.70]KAF1814556.1 Nucleotidylyl transferase [Eremomyces bilateralis CBS 781.70]